MLMLRLNVASGKIYCGQIGGWREDAGSRTPSAESIELRLRRAIAQQSVEGDRRGTPYPTLHVDRRAGPFQGSMSGPTAMVEDYHYRPCPRIIRLFRDSAAIRGSPTRPRLSYCKAGRPRVGVPLCAIPNRM